MATVYDIGDTVRLYGVFKAATFSVAAGVPSATYALTDPSTVSLLIETPAGVQTTYTYAGATVTKDSTGVFYRDLALTVSGQNIARWTGTGSAVAGGETTIQVRPQTAS